MQFNCVTKTWNVSYNVSSNIRPLSVVLFVYNIHLYDKAYHYTIIHTYTRVLDNTRRGCLCVILFVKIFAGVLIVHNDGEENNVSTKRRACTYTDRYGFLQHSFSKYGYTARLKTRKFCKPSYCYRGIRIVYSISPVYIARRSSESTAERLIMNRILILDLIMRDTIYIVLIRYNNMRF